MGVGMISTPTSSSTLPMYRQEILDGGSVENRDRLVVLFRSHGDIKGFRQGGGWNGRVRLGNMREGLIRLVAGVVGGIMMKDQRASQYGRSCSRGLILLIHTMA